jgi:hypothetical protein
MKLLDRLIFIVVVAVILGAFFWSGYLYRLHLDIKDDIRHGRLTDGDNIAKCVCDSLNGLAWKDDSQVSRLSINKTYSNNHQEQLTVYIDDLTWFDC